MNAGGRWDLFRHQVDLDPLVPVIDCDAPIPEDLLVTEEREEPPDRHESRLPRKKAGLIAWDRSHLHLFVPSLLRDGGSMSSIDVRDRVTLLGEEAYGVSALNQMRDLGLLPTDDGLDVIFAWGDLFNFQGMQLCRYLRRKGDRWVWRAAFLFATARLHFWP